jgi:tRNA 2-selenouridine synthase
MAINKLSIEDFLVFAKQHPVLDVRSPGEFEHAHIPGALSFPLFTNEERKVVGTAYKQESREKAIKIGLDYFGKNMVNLVEAAEKIILTNKNSSREVGVHCWRGGMRSASIAWLLDLYGFKVNLLQGGYKAYRHWVLKQLDGDYDLKILGGYTGSNKTGLLTLLNKTHNVIDLEGMAGHKGSAYGNLDMVPQPGQEFFENLLATELYQCSLQKSKGSILLEGESQRIGTVNIPLNFYKAMRKSPLLVLNVPFQTRLNFISQEYGK